MSPLALLGHLAFGSICIWPMDMVFTVTFVAQNKWLLDNAQPWFCINQPTIGFLIRWRAAAFGVDNRTKQKHGRRRNNGMAEIMICMDNGGCLWPSVDNNK